jgi:hypothetical protein
MAWIESHQEILQHPKTRKLAYSLEISVPTAIGHLHCLWWWAMSYAKDGDLAEYDDVDIAIGAQWMGDPETFVKALVSVGFLDLHSIDEDCKSIHDWDQYGGKLLAKREADADRKRRTRDVSITSTGHPPDIHRTAQVEKKTKENNREEERLTSFATANAAKAKRAATLPDDFSVDDEMTNWALAKGFSFQEIDEQTERFQNHAVATGRKQVDWKRSWMNWLTSPINKPHTPKTANGFGPKGPDAAYFANKAIELERQGR